MSVQTNVCPEVQIQVIVHLVQVLLLSFYRCAVTVQFLNRLSFCSREVSKDNYEGEQQRLGGCNLQKVLELILKFIQPAREARLPEGPARWER